MLLQELRFLCSPIPTHVKAGTMKSKPILIKPFKQWWIFSIINCTCIMLNKSLEVDYKDIKCSQLTCFSLQYLWLFGPLKAEDGCICLLVNVFAVSINWTIYIKALRMRGDRATSASWQHIDLGTGAPAQVVWITWANLATKNKHQPVTLIFSISIAKSETNTA